MLELCRANCSLRFNNGELAGCDGDTRKLCRWRLVVVDPWLLSCAHAKKCYSGNEEPRHVRSYGWPGSMKGAVDDEGTRTDQIGSLKALPPAFSQPMETPRYAPRIATAPAQPAISHSSSIFVPSKPAPGPSRGGEKHMADQFMAIIGRLLM